ncbi:MAG: 7-carboxy-7-deazaguanine synthase QueE [Candidatus Aminicenantes bacterium]|nr:7-carboxy-7-deazaguanine synthase QueE [Candidatus Aminicenantes bacterium]
MPQPPTLKISEVFFSIQGEGLRQGEPTIIIRFAGCNLNCSFCDTRYAWEGGRTYSSVQVIHKVRRLRERFPARWVCLTGGEPLLQDLGELVRLLKREKFKIQVETNATRYSPFPFDWITISPKPKRYAYAPEYKKLAREVKLVVTKDLELATIRRMRQAFPARTPILLQPQSNRRWSQKRALRLLHESLAAGLDNIKLSLQMHKILGLR